MQAKEIEEANAQLMERLVSVEHKHNAVLSEAQALDSDLQSKSAQNDDLQAQVRQLRASLSVRPCYISSLLLCRHVPVDPRRRVCVILRGLSYRCAAGDLPLDVFS